MIIMVMVREYSRSAVVEPSGVWTIGEGKWHSGDGGRNIRGGEWGDVNREWDMWARW